MLVRCWSRARRLGRPRRRRTGAPRGRACRPPQAAAVSRCGWPSIERCERSHATRFRARVMAWVSQARSPSLPGALRRVKTLAGDGQFPVYGVPSGNAGQGCRRVRSAVVRSAVGRDASVAPARRTTARGRPRHRRWTDPRTAGAPMAMARRRRLGMPWHAASRTAPASSSARCSCAGARPARSASWVRQEKPSARTTASPRCADGGAEVVLEHRRRRPRSGPSPCRSCRRARSSRRRGSAWRRPGGAAPRRRPSRAPRRGGSAAGRRRRCRRGRAAASPSATPRCSARVTQPVGDRRRPSASRSAGVDPRAPRGRTARARRPGRRRAPRRPPARSSSRAEPGPGLLELAGAHPGQPAALVAERDARCTRCPARLEHRDRRVGDLGGEPVGEGVDPEHDVGGRRTPAPRPAALTGRRRQPGQRAARVDAGERPCASRGASLSAGVGQRAAAPCATSAGSRPRRVVGQRAAPAGVLPVQPLGLVGRHVDAGRAVAGTALAGQAEVERVLERRRSASRPRAAR